MAEAKKGWFMLLDPKSGHVLAATPMNTNECNDAITQTLDKVKHLYPSTSCFIYDRCGQYDPSIRMREDLKHIRFWAVDKLHAKGHVKCCKHSPYNAPRLLRRLRGVSTQIAEQTFAWLRKYRVSFEEIRSCRHHLLLFHYCQRHNDLVDKGSTDHLPGIGVRKLKRRPVPYACTPARNGRRMLRRPAAPFRRPDASQA